MKKKVANARPTINRANLNPAFFANAKKTNVDEVHGWAFDFDNPDSGATGRSAPGTQPSSVSNQEEKSTDQSKSSVDTFQMSEESSASAPKEVEKPKPSKTKK